MLLDTCIVIDSLRGHLAADAFIGSLRAAPAISVVTLTELIAGAKSRREENDISAALAALRIVPATEDIAMRAGQWIRHYRGSHGLDVADAIIAATAEHQNLPLATLNLKHFPMFPKLKRPY